MSDNCIFCQIIAGEIPSYKLYEDDHLLMILDAFPMVEGHALIMPKAHYPSLDTLSPDDHGVLSFLPRAVKAVQELTGADGINLLQNNGTAAGQQVPHLHFHLLPRFKGDSLIAIPPQTKLEPETAKRLCRDFRIEK